MASARSQSHSEFGFPILQKVDIHPYNSDSKKHCLKAAIEKPFLKVSHFCLPGKQSGEWEQGRFLALELLFVLDFTIPWL